MRKTLPRSAEGTENKKPTPGHDVGLSPLRDIRNFTIKVRLRER